MGLERTGYLPLRRFPKSEIVPSSVDRFLRKTTLQGFVHDEAAAFQGGVSGNAGLFSNAREVAQVYQMLLKSLKSVVAGLDLTSRIPVIRKRVLAERMHRRKYMVILDLPGRVPG